MSKVASDAEVEVPESAGMRPSSVRRDRGKKLDTVNFMNFALCRGRPAARL